MFKEKTKKLALGLIASLLSASLFTAVQVKNVTAFQLQGISTNTDAGRNTIKLWVYNADNVAHENGDVVVWYDGTLADGLEVSTTTTANNSLVAGVVYPDTISATAWGFIMVRGYHSAITTTGTVAAGDLLTTSTTGESARAYTVADATGTVAGQGDDFGVVGVALAADDSNVAPGFVKF